VPADVAVNSAGRQRPIQESAEAGHNPGVLWIRVQTSVGDCIYRQFAERHTSLTSLSCEAVQMDTFLFPLDVCWLTIGFSRAGYRAATLAKADNKKSDTVREEGNAGTVRTSAEGD
jgi:hypothetical protein